jgi:hypothetical protein
VLQNSKKDEKTDAIL